MTVSLNGVSLQRGDKLLIEGLSLSVTAGDLVYVTGENGIGKTSLLLALAGLLKPDTGSIDYNINNIAQTPFESVALMSQPDGASRGLTALEDLQFFGRLYGDQTPPKTRLHDVGISNAAHVKTEGLSLGQRKRLSLAKIMASQRSVWLLDEPFSALDKTGRDFVAHTIATHLSSGGICLIATHHPTDIQGHTHKTLHLTQAAS